MALQYDRLGVRAIAGQLTSKPIDYSKTQLTANDFVADAYIQKLKAGVFVKMTNKGYIDVAGGDAADTPIGVIVESVDGYANQNVNALACGLATVLVGIGNEFITDNVKDEDIKAGDALYIGTDGVLTKTKATLDKVVAVALSGNSTGNKAIVVQTL